MFWLILEELLNIWKITSSQITSTVQRPFWGPISLGHGRKTASPSPRRGSGTLIQVPHGATDSLWRCSVQEGPSPKPTNAALPRWLWRTAMIWGTNTWTGLVQRQVNTPLVLWTLHRALQVSFKPQVWQTAWGGLVLQQDNQCGSTLHALMEITSTHQLQTLVREVLSFWSPEKLSTTQLRDQDLEGTWQAFLVKMYFLYLHYGERRMDKGVG